MKISVSVILEEQSDEESGGEWLSDSGLVIYNGEQIYPALRSFASLQDDSEGTFRESLFGWEQGSYRDLSDGYTGVIV